MNRAPLTIAVGALLVAAAVVLYLEWWRAGELEVLSRRVDELDLRRRRDPVTEPPPASSSAKRTRPKGGTE